MSHLGHRSFTNIVSTEKQIHVVITIMAETITFSAEQRDGWMTCDFKSFSTVFRFYQDDGRMVMKSCVQ